MYVLSVNQRRRGQTQQAWTSLGIGVVASAHLFATSIILPNGVGQALPMAATIAILYYAKRDDALLEEHVRRGA